MSNAVSPGSPGAAIVAEEERLLGQVQARAALGDEEDGGPRATTDDVDADLVSLRDQISEARAEDLPPLIEQMTRLAALRSRLGGSRTLPIDLQSPYFAHIRLREQGKRRDVMIGKRGFIDRTSNVQIVDWRNAPVSRIYYRYEEGDDYEEEFAGKSLDGVVEARRNISIHKGALRRIGAPQGTFIKDARGAWQEAVGTMQPVLHGGVGKAARPVVATGGTKGRLGVHHGQQIRADKALPEIAALIDKDQFELISHPESGIVVIQGGAGSGKTTVALHRVAYLNFADGRRFRPNAMLFVVPSAALVRYVSGVLPALGVSGVPVTTYTSWARTTRMKVLPDAPIKYNADPPEQVSRVKKHPRFLTVLAELVAEQTATVTVELAAVPGVGDQVLGEWTRLAKRALVPRLWGMLTWVRKAEHLDPAVRIACEGLLKRWRKRADDVVTDWAELLTDPVALARGFAGCDDVSAKDLERVVAWVKRQIAAPAKPVVDDDGVAVVAADGSTLGVDDDDPAGRVDDEDDPLWLRLVQLKRGGLFTPDGDQLQYSHVAIDEAQDRSAIEVKVLVEAVHAPEGRVDHRSVTIAGDTAQRLVFDNNFSGWADLLMQTGQPAIVRPLKLSYRSTAEVMLLAREVLGPELAPDEALAARPGEPVELHEFSDIGEAVAFLSDALRNLMAREPTASCCVIARHPEQADAYFSGLARAEIPALRRVKRDEFSFQPGIDVTDVTQVKGLEFDYVVMIEVNAQSYPAVNWARHLLHIGVTRAAHQLWLVSTTEPSPLIPAALRDGGRMTVG
ncbi:MAG: ATP-binding domain-containing protein [Kofleriaceae bacterium]|jgi:DNA helicase-2/ATP-dependent DNA helicase PcrA|nr:ATP-binding domain-containing protein [Kofleriaceae bacterium]MBP9170813.1 ATP-binding domain-containing protein [Kofleriaceae bacterium]MBP9857672.1 ATP-binding domain-containing protein [Kofleriaceae bacterium]